MCCWHSSLEAYSVMVFSRKYPSSMLDGSLNSTRDTVFPVNFSASSL